jgi:hypothetical protein
MGFRDLVLGELYLFLYYRLFAVVTVTVLDTVELGYNVVEGTEYFVSIQTSVAITEVYNVMVNSEELIGTTEYMTL